MPRRDELDELIAAGRLEEAAGWSRTHAGGLRAVHRLLYDDDLLVRHRAALVLGRAARAEPARFADLPARLLWSLNDESGMSCPGAAPAIAELALAAPLIAGSWVAPLVHTLEDGDQLESVLWSIERLAAAFPEAVVDLAGPVAGFLSHARPGCRAQAARALGRLSPRAAELAVALRDDGAVVRYVEGGALVVRTVAQVVALLGRGPP